MKVYLLYEREGTGYGIDRMLCVCRSLEAAKLAAEKWEIYKYDKLKEYGDNLPDRKALEWNPPKEFGDYFSNEGFTNMTIQIYNSNTIIVTLLR